MMDSAPEHRWATFWRVLFHLLLTAARDGIEGLMRGLLHRNQMRLLRGGGGGGGVLCSVVHSSAVLLLFFVFVRAYFDAISSYLCSPGSHVS